MSGACLARQIRHYSGHEIMTQPAPPPPALDPVRWLNNQPYLLLSLTSLFWAGNIVLARHVGRPRAAANAVLRPLDRHLSDPAALCLAAPEEGLAGAARASADDAVPVAGRVRLQQCDLLLGPAIYRGAERAVDPVGRTAVRGA